MGALTTTIFLYIFSTQIHSGATSPCNFWKDAEYFDGYCYKIFKQFKTFSDANASCIEEGSSGHGILAEAQTDEQLSFLREMAMFVTMEATVPGIYIGGGLDLTASQLILQPSDLLSNTITHDQGPCVIISNSPSRELLESSCNSRLYYACQQYVGDLCQNVLTGGEFFGGYCFKYDDSLVEWKEAQTQCQSQGNFLTEPKTEEMFIFVQHYARKVHGSFQTIPPQNVFIEIDQIWITNNILSLGIKACRTARLIFSTNSILSVNSDFYELMIGDANNTKVRLSICAFNISGCDTIIEKPVSILNCTKFTKFTIDWSGDKFELQEAYTDTIISQNMPHDNLISINYVTMSMANEAGVLYLPGRPSENPYVCLGATDVETESDFRWETSNDSMTLSDWQKGRPDNYGDVQHYLALSDSMKWLNDIDGVTTCSFICQREVFVFKYVAVFPSAKNNFIRNSDIRVTNHEAYDVQLRITENFHDNHQKSKTTIGWAAKDLSYKYNIDEGLEMIETGVLSSYVLVQASHDVTVTYFRVSNIEATGSPVFLINKIASSYLLLLLADSNNVIITTAVEDNTDIAITFPFKTRQSYTVSFKKVVFSQSESIKITLQKYETAGMHIFGEINATSLLATKPVAVILSSEPSEVSNSATVATLDYTLDTIIPRGFLATSYITFPTFPISDDVDVFKVLSVCNTTSIEVYTSNNQSMNVLQSGTAVDIVLPRTGFYFLKSDVPFYATKTTSKSLNGTCATSLLPLNLWRAHYDFDVPEYFSGNVYVIITGEISMASPIWVNEDEMTNDITCHAVSGTDFSGCFLRLNTAGTFRIRTMPEKTFAAYMYAYSQGRSICYPLGADLGISIESDRSFGSSHYSNKDSIECQMNKENTPWNETSTDNTSESSATTGNGISINTETASSWMNYPRSQPTWMSESTTAPVWISESKATSVLPNDSKITSAWMNGTQTTSAWMNDSKTTSSWMNDSQTSLVWMNVSRMTSTWINDSQMTSTWMNHSQTMSAGMDDNQMTSGWMNDPTLTSSWLLNPRTTSSWRRSKTSAPDSRISAKAMAAVGVFFLCFFVLLLAIADIMTLLKRRERKKDKSKKSHDLRLEEIESSLMVQD